MSRECAYVEEHAFEALSGELEGEAYERYARHVAGCRPCRQHITSVQAVLEMTRARGDVVLPAESEDRVLRTLAPLFDELAAHERPGIWHGLRWALVPAVAAAAAVLVIVLQPDTQPLPLTTRIEKRVGHVEISESDDQSILSTGCQLSTAPESTVLVRVGDDRLALLAESRVRLVRLEHADTTLQLDAGSLAMDVVPGRAGRNVTVKAPFGTVRVIGTLFRVSTEAGGEVATLRGSVRVYRHGDNDGVEVKGGQFLSIDSGELRSLSADESRIMDASLDATEPLEAKKPSPPTSERPARTRSPRKAEPSPAKKARDLLSDALAARDCDRALSLATSVSSQAHRERAEALSLVGECHLSSKEEKQALEIFEKIRRKYSKTPAGENALFEVGRLSEKLGQHDEARRAFQAYVRDYRHGPLVADARFRLCSIFLRAKRYDEALRCLRAFRKRHRRGERFVEALFLEATLHKDVKGDHSSAAALFDRYVQEGTGDKLEEACYWRAFSLKQVDDNRFESAARDYLKRFPDGPHAERVEQWLTP